MTEQEIHNEESKISTGLHRGKAVLVAAALDFVIVGSVLTGKIPLTGETLIYLGALNFTLALNAAKVPTCMEKYLAARVTRRNAASEMTCG